MNLHFLDTSALVKLYVRELGTDGLLHVARDPQNQLVILALSAIELRSAIRRRERAGDLVGDTAATILSTLDNHLKGRLISVPLTDAILDTARDMIDRYPLRAYDAVQLAACISLRLAATFDRLMFVCSDKQLLEAARSERLQVLDPTRP